jgi:hypothetical protein
LIHHADTNSEHRKIGSDSFHACSIEPFGAKPREY